jgi:hypothetical protein
VATAGMTAEENKALVIRYILEVWGPPQGTLPASSSRRLFPQVARRWS